MEPNYFLPERKFWFQLHVVQSVPIEKKTATTISKRRQLKFNHLHLTTFHKNRIYFKFNFSPCSVVVRMIGLTASSCNIRTLLKSLSLQICHIQGETDLGQLPNVSDLKTF